MNHVETVREMYEAFSRGDVETILGHISDQVDWEYGTSTPDVPWLERRRGRQGAAEFFKSLSGVDFHVFNPKAIIAHDNTVVVLLDLDATVKATGRRIVEEDQVHIWHFDEDGKVSRFRHRADTLMHWKAVMGQ
jgi:ketosteroid isomerase-like protein